MSATVQDFSFGDPEILGMSRTYFSTFHDSNLALGFSAQ